MSEVLRMERGRTSETDPIEPTRYYAGDREISEARYVELMAQRPAKTDDHWPETGRYV